MRSNKNHIVRAWLILLFFAAGQFAVWSHQHIYQNNTVAFHQQQHPHPVLAENCKLCDAMHHNYVSPAVPMYFPPVRITGYKYQQAIYAFTSISLILSGGRSPPVA